MSTPGFMSPRLNSPMHESNRNINGSIRSDGGSSVAKSPRPPMQQNKSGTRRDVSLIGQTVRITQGPYKGYIGMVKDATDTTARVELHTKCQTISVDRVRLSVVGGVKAPVKTPQGGFATPAGGGQTPAAGFGGRTPMYGSQTPLYDGSRTPHYGGATPRHDGSATPNANSAWDPTSSQTPREDFEADDYWDDQPNSNLNPTTPGYQAETPETHSPFTPGAGLNYTTHSPYNNPSPMDGYQHSLYSNQVPTPGSNYGSVNSPANSYQNFLYSPATPGGFFAPQTPGTTTTHYDAFDWHLDGLLVRIKDSYRDFAKSTGIIKSIHGSQCSLHLTDQDKTINIQLDFLEPVQPQKGDRVAVIFGDDKGAVGRLLSIDGIEGVIKLENRPEREEITMKQLKYLCKLADS